MLANFKKLNSKKDEKHTRIPKELLKVLNQGLPDELEYIPHDDGMCSINPVSNKKNNTISMTINIPESALKYKDIIKTSADLVDYAYRTQQTLYLKPYEDNTILMNGHRIKLEQLITFPLDEQKKLKNGEFIIQPPSFKKLEPIVLDAGKVSLKFKAERKPYDSMNKIYIQLTYKNLIVIDTIFNEHDSKSNWTIKINPDTKNADDLYKIFVFYNHFGRGNVKYRGEKFAKSTNKTNFSFVDKSDIELLKKIVKLEKKLNIVFEMPLQVRNKECELVNQLYTSLILNRPIKEFKPFNELTCTVTTLYNKDFENMKNKDVLLTSCNSKTIELFGKKIELYLLQAIFHMIINENEICDENTVKLKIDDTNKNMFVSFKYFINEEAVIKFQNTSNWIAKLENAKQI